MTHIYRNTLFFFIISFLIYITLQSIDNQMMLYFAAAFYFGIIQHLQELFIKNILITFLLSAIILISFVAIYFRINNKIYKFVIIVLLAYLLYIIDIVHLFLKYPYNTFSKYALITNSFKLLVRPMQRQDNANLTNENLIHQIE